MAKILLILTGGTICCQKRDGVLSSCTETAELQLVDDFRHSDSPWREAEFCSRFPLDTLSENMTVDYWQLILEELRQTDLAAWDGIILVHGTDTLAFSAALLDAALDGCRTPLVMVASNYPLADARANGGGNFRAAVELICDRLLPGGVWAVYRNSDGRTWLHRGRELRQSEIGSDDFFSLGARDTAEIIQALPALPGPETLPLLQAGPLTNCVLLLRPYVGLDYSRFDLTGLRAVVHGVYHSGTACTGRKSPDQPYGSSSLLSLVNRCRERGIPFFIGPLSYGPRHDPYSTMADYLASCAIPVTDISPESVYARAVLGCAIYADRESLVAYVKGSVS